MSTFCSNMEQLGVKPVVTQVQENLGLRSFESAGPLSALCHQLAISWNPSEKHLLLVPNNEMAELALGDLKSSLALHGATPTFDFVHILGHWDHSPYSGLQPGVSSRHQRCSALWNWWREDRGCWLIATPQALAQNLPSRDFLLTAPEARAGSSASPEAWEERLVSLGYTKDETTEDPGTYSSRGGIIDFFSPGNELPVRIVFDDEKIESVRFFNPETQRTIRDIHASNGVFALPNREFSCNPLALMSAREKLREWCDQNEISRNRRERILTLMAQGYAPPELDYLLPLWGNIGGKESLNSFFQNTKSTVVIDQQDCASLHKGFFSAEQGRFQSQNDPNIGRLLPPPENLFVDWPDLDFCLGNTKRRDHSTLPIAGVKLLAHSLRPKHESKKKDQPHKWAEKFQELAEKGVFVVLAIPGTAQSDRARLILRTIKINCTEIQCLTEIKGDPRVVRIFQGNWSESAYFEAERLALVSERDFFGSAKSFEPQRTRSQGSNVLALSELGPGDFVVHRDHGLGRYAGLQTVPGPDGSNDFAVIDYASGDRLYLPIYRLDHLSRYVSPEGSGRTTLDKLGGSTFKKAKEKVSGALKEIAQDLLKVQAERQIREGFAFSLPDEEYARFESEFPYEETPDQLRAIQDVLGDMCQKQPMDRLVCGDVGFGKTEVAIRAAFKAAQDGKQVAVLVPTTILCEQHLTSFAQRFKNFPVRVDSLSRFRSKPEQKETVAALADGRIDVIVGTHRLLSSDIKFKDLGLLIIDEEQRFGVEHKEKLKLLRASTDVLTLTATPIPRTLQLSLMGLRDVSTISTPPGARLSIKTHLAPFDWSLIAEAVRAETSRGGQCFFIHNRVETIWMIARELREAVPEARVVVGHGQMSESELERAMLAFYRGEADVLLATTIVENGLDVPNANTLIVDRADTFGLSQLYQIRGRVGRSQVRAHAYLLLPSNLEITDDARSRLQTLERFAELGSGYAVACHDLELRGGGDILGQSQSGHIASVGYELYLEMLEEEVRRQKGETIPLPEAREVEINLPFTAMLPEHYVPDHRSRLSIYRKLSAVNNEDQASEMESELLDRYGPMPVEARELLHIIRLKALMLRLGLNSITLGSRGASLGAGPDPMVSTELILALASNHPEQYALLPEGRFLLKGKFHSAFNLHGKLKQLFTASFQ
jgi:transcription-repair coupling factor (superfamily II helicase)